MRFFFFETSLIDRGSGPQPTLRALEGQTFDDGEEVDTSLNVQAPKEPGSSANGCRLEYPEGTAFCSTFLKKITRSSGVDFYTVYNTENNEAPGKTDPDFHPVTIDPNFVYKKDSHKSDTMNAAYSNFIRTGEQFMQVDGENTSKKQKKTETRTGPSDINGKARVPQALFEPLYDDQLNIETELIVQWMKNLLNILNVKNPARRPRAAGDTTLKVEELFRAGESVDTIASRSRFNKVMNAQKMDSLGLANINKGPMDWYLDELINEHNRQMDCTAMARDAENTTDVEDTAFILSKEMDSVYGTSIPVGSDPAILKNIKTAIGLGWTIDEMLNPDIINQKDNIVDLSSSLASGVIPVPNKGKTGKSLFESIADDNKLKCPAVKDGFYVDKKVWLLLVRNLKVKQNTLLTGPSGSGKTELVKKLCEVTNTPLTIIQMGGVTDVTEHLVGKLDLDPSTGGTKFDWAEFALAIQRPGVILLDEINRIPRGGSNILFSVLDNTRVLHANGAKSSDTREIKVNPDCCFFATANLGSEFTDANEIDEALRTRLCAQIPLGFMDVKTEASVLEARTGIDKQDARSIAEVAANIRREYKKQALQYNISVRETLYTAELVRDGLDVEDALECGVLCHYEKGLTDNDPSSEWGQVKAIIASHFNTGRKKA